VARIVAGNRALHLDHIGAQIGQHLRGPGPASTRDRSSTLMPASAPVGVVSMRSCRRSPETRNYENRSCLRFIGMGFDRKTIQNPYNQAVEANK
jgi:hypothetical protein